jgi:hypothetical protein
MYSEQAKLISVKIEKPNVMMTLNVIIIYFKIILPLVARFSK